jgi:hypothetical protein
LILDEVQSGYGRSGYFFAHQEFELKQILSPQQKEWEMVSDWRCFNSSEISGK